MAEAQFTTFRDPAGKLCMEDDRVLRTVHPAYAQATESFLSSDLAKELVASGALVATRRLGWLPDGSLELEHEKIDFPSYPWEWSAAQWVDAALLTLEICDRLLDQGLILKDATPLNILFAGPRPVLVDVLSVEQRKAETPIWNAYGQFVRCFLLPLYAHKYLGWPLATARFRRDGFEPEDLYSYLSLRRRWSGVGRGYITLPILLDRFAKSGKKRATMRLSAGACTAILHGRMRSLRKAVKQLAPPKAASHWSGYTTHCDHYSLDARARKEIFLKEALQRMTPKTVLDIGANTGVFSRIAAASGARVVSLDIDAASTELNYLRAKKNGSPILPLHADFARPTPSAGWRNLESLSLLKRCRGRFDCVLMLGLLHHLLVSDQIPLEEIAVLVQELAPQWIVVEWIPPNDPKFIEICRGRDELYQELNETALHAAFVPAYRAVQREQLDNGRVLLLMEAQ